jgi:hypothetical protein
MFNNITNKIKFEIFDNFTPFLFLNIYMIVGLLLIFYGTSYLSLFIGVFNLISTFIILWKLD